MLIENRSDREIIAIFEATNSVKLEAPAGLLLRELTGTNGCAPRQGAVMRCSSAAAMQLRAAITVVQADGVKESVALGVGCTAPILTWPVFTPLAIVAAGIDPPEALDAIWKSTPSSRGFVGFSPDAPAGVNTYSEFGPTLSSERVYVCLRTPATLTRPILGPLLPPGVRP